MANELVRVYGVTKTLESNGASLAENAAGQADDGYYSIDLDGGGFPDAEFVLKASYAVAPYLNGAINLYAQPLDVDGENDTPVPSHIYPNRLIGAFCVKNVTGVQYLTCVARDVPRYAAYWIHTLAGQTLSAGWTLKVTPRTVKPAT